MAYGRLASMCEGMTEDEIKNMLRELNGEDAYDAAGVAECDAEGSCDAYDLKRTHDLKRTDGGGAKSGEKK